jgi:hypothetical protein
VFRRRTWFDCVKITAKERYTLNKEYNTENEAKEEKMPGGGNIFGPGGLFST